MTEGVVPAAAAAAKHDLGPVSRGLVFALCVRCALPVFSEVNEESLKLLLALRHVCWPAYAAFTSLKAVAS